jgi:sporulation integral membrane protein YtvI
MYHGIRKALTLAGAALGLWLGVRFLLPLALPFLLGLGLALAAEPMTGLLCSRLRFRRGAAAGISVTATFCLFLLLISLLFALILREMGVLMRVLPNLEEALSGGLSSLSGWALSLAQRIPGSLGKLLEQNIREFFSGGSTLLRQAFRYSLSITGGLLTRVPGSALVLGTAVISGYMISARLPRIKDWLLQRLSRERLQKFLTGLRHLKTVIFAWLKAQLKLMGITWLILTLGLVLLRIPYAPLWASAVALVDAFPILGTGTVLLPWALVSFLQQDTVRAVGLLGVYAVITLTRSVLEPKLLGDHLGLDPLVTLVAIYTGFQLWGFGGMLLAPLLAVTAVQLFSKPE